MCGRFVLTADAATLLEAFGLEGAMVQMAPRYNIAPTQPILMIASAGLTEPGSNRPDRKAVLVRWGLIPSWAKDPKDLPLLINARSETAAEKASFRAAMKRRRTLVPASGFYEWRRAGEKKSQPFWVPPSSGGIVAFGALMETWHSPDGSEIDTGAILTTAANAEIAPIHDRMPLVIEPGDWTRWLDPLAENPCDIADLVHPAPDRTFAPMAVSDKVNKVANVGADLQEPIQGVPTPKPAGSKPGGSRQGSLF